MIVNLLKFVQFIAICLYLGASVQAEENVKIVYLGVKDDRYYQPQPIYTGLSLKDRHRPIDGARTAMRGTRVLGRALGINFTLEELLLEPQASVESAIIRASKAGTTAILLDIPESQMRKAINASPDGPVLFNIRNKDDHWRGDGCGANLLHTMPSRSMLTDALAQHLRHQNWSTVLVLFGNTLEDQKEVEAIRGSASKFGLKISAEKPFQVTNDPRLRKLSNIRLLTGDVRYDVIWIVDETGEFGRYVPFSSTLPRPIAGSEGLVATAWHWTWERHGAPQLNQRFRRKIGRDMKSLDWAAWTAVQAVIGAVRKSESTNQKEISAVLRSPELTLDLYKGVRGNFRNWDGQLRQPILLTTHNAVIATAPLDGFEHRSDKLDTLGIDQSQTKCKL